MVCFDSLDNINIRTDLVEGHIKLSKRRRGVYVTLNLYLQYGIVLNQQTTYYVRTDLVKRHCKL